MRRLDLGQLQEEIAERIGVDKTTIYNWEGNRTTPAIREIPAIIQFLGYAPFAPASSLPQRLRLYRKMQGLSRRKLARRLGVDESTLAEWETGRGYPGKESLKTLEGVLKSSEKEMT